MTDHDVVIVGAGPTGLMLAAELAIAGVDVGIVERRTTQEVDGSRAGGLLARTIEVLDQRGVAARFLDAGTLVPAQAFAGTVLDIGDLPSRHNHVLALWQREFEPILADWVLQDLRVPIRRGREVVGVVQDDDGVEIEVAGEGALRARYVVGCDGAHSVVRRHTTIGFTGPEPTTSWLAAEVEMAGEPETGMRDDDIGSHGLGPLAAAGTYRVVLTERRLESGDPSVEELHDALVAVYGTDFDLREVRWLSRFTDAARQATTYRDHRVLVAGDAAHIHSPHGGQGLNTGVQDAVNLGWKLARVVHGAAPETLLDTYHDERHPVGARAIRAAMAQAALSTGGAHHRALREIMTELLGMDEPRRHIAGMLSGLDIRYELGGEHPLVGRRMPDLDLRTDDGITRVCELLHEARPLLLRFGPGGDLDGPPLPAWVREVSARPDGTWELPVVGVVPAPDSVLVRPDGYVAWAGDPDDPALADVVDTWCGPSPAP